MLGELDTYTIRQFIPMTPEVYFRLFERLNELVWPWQVPALTAAAIAAVLAWRRHGVVAGVLLGACWFWVAAVFQFRLHAELNWAGPYFGWAFLVQGVLMVIAGARGRLDGVPGARAMTGAVMIGAALVLYPLLGPLTGRAWAGVELAGTAPDPTVILTLGVLLVPARIPWTLVPIPVLWCLYSGATWWAVGWMPGLVNTVAILALALGAALSRRPGTAS